MKLNSKNHLNYIRDRIRDRREYWKQEKDRVDPVKRVGDFIFDCEQQMCYFYECRGALRALYEIGLYPPSVEADADEEKGNDG